MIKFKKVFGSENQFYSDFKYNKSVLKQSVSNPFAHECPRLHSYQRLEKSHHPVTMEFVLTRRQNTDSNKDKTHKSPTFQNRFCHPIQLVLTVNVLAKVLNCPYGPRKLNLKSIM